MFSGLRCSVREGSRNSITVGVTLPGTAPQGQSTPSIRYRRAITVSSTTVTASSCAQIPDLCPPGLHPAAGRTRTRPGAPYPLDVGVDDMVGVQEGQRLQHLLGDALHSARGEVGGVIALRVEQVAAQQLDHQEQVALRGLGGPAVRAVRGVTSRRVVSRTAHGRGCDVEHEWVVQGNGGGGNRGARPHTEAVKRRRP
jgi:hypothetical protein